MVLALPSCPAGPAGPASLASHMSVLRSALTAAVLQPGPGRGATEPAPGPESTDSGDRVTCGNRVYDLRRLRSDDRDDVVALARALPEIDLQFLRSDLTDPVVVEGWIRDAVSGRRFTTLAHHNDELVGYGSLNLRGTQWMSHLGEIRVLVAEDHRRSGLGRVLTQRVFDLAHDLGLLKLVAQMTREQIGARRLFERLGFSPEALLTDWVIDRSRRTRDMMIMSYDVGSATRSRT